ncbi:serine/threonine-protein kinase [Variovorax sp. NFACC27]|uniref:serine/threonine-protein kinase n=1 Tax=unclassified Variovorax TaxID=663243 RepID=UPI003AAFA580
MDRKLDREVAIKTPLTSSAAKRFEESAQLSARVRHPNVASALDYFIDGNTAYFAEELIHGINLQQCFDAHFWRLCADTTAKLLHNLAKGLAASHEVGVIHRDLKPSNIMVSRDLSFTMVKITDFGIAKLAEKQLEADLKNQHENSATSSTLIGAIPFMAPEAVSKASVKAPPGPKMDVWALGAIAYYLLTGKHPFGHDITAVVGILAGNPPKKPEANILGGATHKLAADLWATILECLKTNAEDRPSAVELVERCAAMRYLDEPRVTAEVTGKDPRTPVWFGESSLGTVALPHGEFIEGQPAVGRRVSCFAFSGNPKPRGVAVMQLK